MLLLSLLMGAAAATAAGAGAGAALPILKRSQWKRLGKALPLRSH